LYIWYVSNVFRCFPFLSIFIIFIISVMVPYACPVFSISLRILNYYCYYVCLECALYIWCGMVGLSVLRILLGSSCNLIGILHSFHIGYFYYCEVLVYFVLFLILNAIFICLSLKSLVIFLVSFP
jgi:hypothetical protein